MDDAALVQAAKRGDDTAWAAIYDRYADKLHDHCHRILRDRDEAADALHDAFLAASRNLVQLRDPSRLRPWLYSICRHTSLRRLKAMQRVDLTDSQDDLMAPDLDLDRGVRTEELTELVWAAAAGLSGRDQALLDLHLRQGLEGQDLADAMGTSLSNSYVMLSRMRDQVERSLGALLIARLGRDDCDELDGILSGWDGKFSPILRKRVARHVDSCEICSDKRKAVVSPLALLAAAPLIPAPSALKGRVISSIRNIDVVDGPHVPFTKEGFAVLGPEERERRAKAAWVATVAAVVLLLGGFFLTKQDDDGSPVLTAAEATSSTQRTRATTPDGSTIPDIEGSTTTSLEDTGDTGDSPGTTAKPGGTTGTTTKPGGTTGTTQPPDTTTKPADTAGPTIGTPRLQVPSCAAGGSRTFGVSVQVTDPAGVQSVQLVGLTSGPVNLTSSKGDGKYGGAVSGSKAGAPDGLSIRATDKLGNVTTTSAHAAFAECPPAPTTSAPPTSAVGVGS
jgi:RNA polymerase sigma factor (sigma-70 family)